jgi:hypothetical protein
MAVKPAGAFRSSEGFDAIEAVIRKVVPRPAPRLLTYEPETALQQ